MIGGLIFSSVHIFAHHLFFYIKPTLLLKLENIQGFKLGSWWWVTHEDLDFCCGLPEEVLIQAFSKFNKWVIWQILEDKRS